MSLGIKSARGHVSTCHYILNKALPTLSQPYVACYLKCPYSTLFGSSSQLNHDRSPYYFVRTSHVPPGPETISDELGSEQVRRQ